MYNVAHHHVQYKIALNLVHIYYIHRVHINGYHYAVNNMVVVQQQDHCILEYDKVSHLYSIAVVIVVVVVVVVAAAAAAAAAVALPVLEPFVLVHQIHFLALPAVVGQFQLAYRKLLIALNQGKTCSLRLVL